MIKHTYTFKEINTGSIQIESMRTLTDEDIIKEIEEKQT